ncbi:MAG: AAA family ATPase [bacterium]
MSRLHTLHIRGFKSIRDQRLELDSLNVFIGGNGAGKSNLVGVFHLLNRVANQQLQIYTGEDRFIFGRETTYFWNKDQYPKPYDDEAWFGHVEAQVAESKKKIAQYIREHLSSYRIYHFNDTSSSARVKQTGDLADNRILREDAANLAAFLYRLEQREPDHFQNIVETVRQVAPFLKRFKLAPSALNLDKIRLEWEENGSDTYFNAAALSDGTLRFVCLATLLLQPVLPSIILIDEPELGLHPAAIQVLAGLMESAATRTQLIVATQSVTLINQLRPEHVWVADRAEGQSIFRHLKAADMSSWLEDYGLGELWEKNILGGRP